MRNLIYRGLFALGGLSLLACGKSSTSDSAVKKWDLLLGEESRQFVAHGCQKQGERLYCLTGESENPEAFPRLTFHLPLPLENREYTIQPVESESEISCQPKNTGLIYRRSNEAEPYFSCAKEAKSTMTVTDSGDDFMEASLSASMADKEGNRLSVSFEKIRFILK